VARLAHRLLEAAEGRLDGLAIVDSHRLPGAQSRQIAKLFPSNDYAHVPPPPTLNHLEPIGQGDIFMRAFVGCRRNSFQKKSKRLN